MDLENAQFENFLEIEAFYKVRLRFFLVGFGGYWVVKACFLGVVSGGY